VHGEALCRARIRTSPAEFCVTETCEIEFTDAGEHDLLWVQKRGQNTQWVAERLAEHARIPVRDVGFAGMKDRHAITEQWFSVRRAGETDWNAFDVDGIDILDRRRHHRKLRRGAHSGNAFRIAVRAENLLAHRLPIEQRLAAIAAEGVPNYFGEQRFGRDGNNLNLCNRLFAGQRMQKSKRSIALSTARSLIFNAILARRVDAGTWNTLLPGEMVNLDGSASVFVAPDVTAELRGRCVEQDIHPTGTLWGDGAPRGTGDVALLEAAVAEQYRGYAEGLVAARVQPASRALRLLVHELHWEFADDALWLAFDLAKGGFATAVLREIVALQEP
jgi:tRNA pseudouridine13 synthase